MTACRSSFFLPETRSCSPWIATWTFSLASLTALTISLAFSVAMPWLDRDDLPHGALRRGLDLAVVEGLERHAALDELRLEDVRSRP